MKHLYFLLLFLSILFSLSLKAQPEKTFYTYKLEDRIKYLESLHHTLKAVQFYEDSTMVASGWKSEEHKIAVDSLLKTDSALTQKIDDYLKTYGYPDKESYGEIASFAPLMVLNNSSNEKVRLRHFSSLYKAYKNDDLEERQLIEFLEREYQLRFRRDFRSYSKSEIRLRELMEVLELKKV